MSVTNAQWVFQLENPSSLSSLTQKGSLSTVGRQGWALKLLYKRLEKIHFYSAKKKFPRCSLNCGAALRLNFGKMFWNMRCQNMHLFLPFHNKTLTFQDVCERCFLS